MEFTSTANTNITAQSNHSGNYLTVVEANTGVGADVCPHATNPNATGITFIIRPSTQHQQGFTALPATANGSDTVTLVFTITLYKTGPKSLKNALAGQYQCTYNVRSHI
jgi:hypothetical protein